MGSRIPVRIIKIGGHEIDDPAFLEQLSQSVDRMGVGSVLVHGGGDSISSLEKRLHGREPVFIEGRRLTDSQTLSLAEMVLCGGVNKKIVRAMAMHSAVKAIGISGQDAGLLRADRECEMGYVACNVVAQAQPILDLCSMGYTPVVAPLALDSNLQPLNANADEVACALAKSLAVEELIYISNVEGIKIEGQYLEAVSDLEAEEFIRCGQITAGMIVKVRAAVDAARSTNARVRICNLDSLSRGRGTVIEMASPTPNVARKTVATGRREATCLAPLFSKNELQVVSAEGMYLVDQRQKRFLDFSSGIAVNALGHRHPSIVAALKAHADLPLHLSNLFPIPEQEELAHQLTSSCFAERVFFCNSGAEANEAALKFAFKHHFLQRRLERKRVVAFKGGFHGRTLGALSVTEKWSYREAFQSWLFDVDFLEFNATEGLDTALTDDVAAVIVEPVQGESGVHIATKEFLSLLRKTCTDRGIVLIFDEVQCGMMRTGKMWAHLNSNVTPDIMTVAKPLGAGLPLGATLISGAIASSLAVGDHGSTFGGNPLACALANVVFREVQKLEQHLGNISQLMFSGLSELRRTFPQWVSEIRGCGLMWAMDVRSPAAEWVDAARRHGLVILTAGSQTLRFLPPLICREEQVLEFFSKFKSVIRDLSELCENKVVIRTATLADAVPVFDLISGFAENKELLPRSLDSVRAEMSRFLIAEWNGVVVGCISRRIWTSLTWEVRSLAVASGAQGFGIGRQLVTGLLAHARAAQVSEVFALSLRPEFFETLGFDRRRRSSYPYKEKMDCVKCEFHSNCQEVAVGFNLSTSSATTTTTTAAAAAEYQKDEFV